MKLTDVRDGFRQFSGKLPDVDFQIRRELPGIGNNGKIERADGEAPDRFIAGPDGPQLLKEIQVEIEDGGAAGVDQFGMKFAQAADLPALPPEFGAAGGVFPGRGAAGRTCRPGARDSATRFNSSNPSGASFE